MTQASSRATRALSMLWQFNCEDRQPKLRLLSCASFRDVTVQYKHVLKCYDHLNLYSYRSLSIGFPFGGQSQSSNFCVNVVHVECQVTQNYRHTSAVMEWKVCSYRPVVSNRLITWLEKLDHWCNKISYASSFPRETTLVTENRLSTDSKLVTNAFRYLSENFRGFSLTRVSTMGVWDFIVGDYDWAFLCTPRLPCGERKPPPPLFRKDEPISLLVALAMGLQHCLAMVNNNRMLRGSHSECSML